MCWSWEVSLGSWIFCMILVGILYRRNHPSDRYFGAFAFVYGQVQLMETFMWLDVDRKSPWKVNEIATAITSIITPLQPIALLYLAPMAHDFHFFHGAKRKRQLRWLSLLFVPKVLSRIYRLIAPFVSSSCTFPYSERYCCVKITRLPHLSWSFDRYDEVWMVEWYYVWSNLFGLFFVGLMKPARAGIPLGIYVIGIFILVAMKWSQVIGSMWCWFAVLGPVIMIVCNWRAPVGKEGREEWIV